ncbi:hypothetical protein DPMN_122789 [Dreissena polymorpha]|uniref:Uncharacterized protein n=1 Tax=Dreissena polymorpha TaxID=45954 RepID=A0A9D4JUS8_DREPO|nr:hypothetical protein DPMN_122789 [Dreissena polymorpha]
MRNLVNWQYPGGIDMCTYELWPYCPFDSLLNRGGVRRERYGSDKDFLEVEEMNCQVETAAFHYIKQLGDVSQE